MTKSLEVKIDGEVVGLFVPPEDNCFGVMLGNVPRTHMRCQVSTGTEQESWYWQLPNIEEGEEISFRLVEAPPNSGRKPSRVVPKDLEEVEERKQAAKAAYKRAMDESDIT